MQLEPFEPCAVILESSENTAIIAATLGNNGRDTAGVSQRLASRKYMGWSVMSGSIAVRSSTPGAGRSSARGAIRITHLPKFLVLCTGQLLVFGLTVVVFLDNIAINVTLIGQF